ncbi:MAG: hypothetical protein K0S76_875 [Herbinix sp.]|jgi:acyl carrier protein|nr:hypothetical protein [Herbinix sp.]
MNNVDVKDIHIRVEQILVNKLNINIELYKRDYDKEALTGRVFNLTPRDLIYLFLELEQEFDCRINTMDILNYEFNTIQGITDVIKKQK